MQVVNKEDSHGVEVPTPSGLRKVARSISNLQRGISCRSHPNANQANHRLPP